MEALVLLVVAFPLSTSLTPCFQPARAMSTIAGTGTAGHSGDGGSAIKAQLRQPFHCELDKRGFLYIAEANNHCIRAVDLKTGLIRTVAGSGKSGYSGDGGKATEATMNEPYAVVVNDQGDLFIVDRLNAVVRKVDGKSGIITTIAGNGKKGYSGDGGKATEAMLREPNDCFLDGKGGLLIADVADWRIRKVDLETGIITTFAGTGKPKDKITDRGRIGDGDLATKAIIVGARAVCMDGRGNTYICEREGNAIRKVDAKGIITTIAGTGKPGYDGDGGDAREATFRGPKGVRCDAMGVGDIYVVETENHAIRKIDAKTNVVMTVAGGRKGSGGDGGDALAAGMDRPHGCVIDAQGNIFIADSNNNRVRKVTVAR
jgi:sugar lactone lactonase YvrE